MHSSVEIQKSSHIRSVWDYMRPVYKATTTAAPKARTISAVTPVAPFSVGDVPRKTSGPGTSKYG